MHALHWLSAGTVSFARGVNDTPKMAALLILIPSVTRPQAVLLVGVAIAIGGLLAARRVAETLSHRITKMTPRQGLAANLATTAVVLSASRLGLPVSTTHVGCSALIGLGLLNGGRQWRTIRKMLLAWVVTVPAAALLSGLVTLLQRG